MRRIPHGGVFFLAGEWRGIARGGASMNWLSDPNAWIGLLTLTGLEIVLGVDNIIFISILSGKRRTARQSQARGSSACSRRFVRGSGCS